MFLNFFLTHALIIKNSPLSLMAAQSIPSSRKQSPVALVTPLIADLSSSNLAHDWSSPESSSSFLEERSIIPTPPFPANTRNHWFPLAVMRRTLIDAYKCYINICVFLSIFTEIVKVIHILLTGIVSIQRGGWRQGHVLQCLPHNWHLCLGYWLCWQPLCLWSLWGTFWFGGKEKKIKRHLSLDIWDKILDMEKIRTEGWHDRKRCNRRWKDIKEEERKEMKWEICTY